jgi:hypothetical protein
MHCGRCFTFDGILGARVVSFHENARAERLVSAAAAAAPVLTNVEADTDNWFFAGQLGALATYECCPWTIYGSLKGLVGASVRQSTVTDGGVFTLGQKTDDSDETGFGWGAEAEVGLKFRLSRCVSVTAGYSVLWLEEVQRANDAFDFSNGAGGQVLAQDDPDAILAQTVFVGLSFTW